MDQSSCSIIIGQHFPDAQLIGVERLTGGVSAEVFRLDLESEGEETSIVLRAHGKTHSGHSAELEFQLLQALFNAGLPTPEPLAVDTSGNIIADPYLLIAFVQGSTEIPAEQEGRCIDAMALQLAKIHSASTAALPELPQRLNPLPEVFEFLPSEAEFDNLRAYLESCADTAYTDTPKLLHGDFWPENLLWQNDAILAVLDWEDAALGDPLSDVAAASVELRYKFGTQGMQRFIQAYGQHDDVNPHRLALWQVYVAAAAHRYMGNWGLPAAREAHMRKEALASIREAGQFLVSA